MFSIIKTTKTIYLVYIEDIVRNNNARKLQLFHFRRRLAFILRDLARIPELLSEQPSFGLSLVSAAVESCFKDVSVGMVVCNTATTAKEKEHVK